MPERDKFIPALINAAAKAGGAVDTDFVWEMFDQVQEMTPEQHARARDILIRCGIERWNEFGKLEINAPLLMQGPAGVRKLFEATLDPDAKRPFVPTDNNDPGTQCGRRNKLSQTQRQEEEIRWLTEELSETFSDRDAVLEGASRIVTERDEAQAKVDALTRVFEQGLAIIRGDAPPAQKIGALSAVFESDDDGRVDVIDATALRGKR